MALPRPAAPRVLLADLRGLLTGGGRHRLVFGTLAVGVTSLIITAFILDARSGIAPGRQIVYATNWSAARTDDEIKAQQVIDERIRQKLKAERRAEYQRLAKQFGIK